jgi:membrane-associated phospholipid phosphatase
VSGAVEGIRPLPVRLLRATRPEDLLALLFTGGLVVLGGVTSIPLPASLRYFAGLILYYGLAFAAVRALRRSTRLSLAWRRGIVGSILLLLVLLTLVAPGELSLETVKNLAALAAPVVLAWAIPARAGGTWTAGSVLRDIAPFLVSDAAYLMLHDVVHRLSPIDRDAWLIAADRWLFRGDLTVWLEPFVRPWLTEWFSAAYSLFLFFPLTLALWFVARGERTPLRHLLLAVIMGNYLGYLGYLLVPAVGPMYTLAYEVPLRGGWFYQIKESMDQLARVPRDCFPSLHTANTFVVLLMVRRYARPLAWLYFPLGGSCIAATIYLRYHYTVDVAVGLLLGGGVTWAAPRLMAAWEVSVERWSIRSGG